MQDDNLTEAEVVNYLAAKLAQMENPPPNTIAILILTLDDSFLQVWFADKPELLAEARDFKKQWLDDLRELLDELNK